MSGSHKSSHLPGPNFRIKVGSDTLRQWMAIFAANIQEAEPVLTELDAAIGDGDHGVNMRRGLNAVSEKLETLPLTDLSGLLRVISLTLTSSVGGASGPLYGAFFLQGSHAAQHKSELGLNDLTATLEAGVRGVVQLGKAAVGDKTMVDTLAAGVRSLRFSCTHYEVLPEALKACRRAARVAAEGTIPMVARKGRASYLGQRSAGVQDPGATSAALLFDSLTEAVAALSIHSQSVNSNPIPS